MLIKTYVAGPIQANNYLVIDEASKEAILIDCSDYVEEIVDYVKENNLKVKYILLTHGHFDHVLGINKMKTALNTKVYVHKADFELASNPVGFMKMFAQDTQGMENPTIDGTLETLETPSIGDIEIKILETSGHTKGCACYLIGENLFSGDTLFYGSIGRTDLPGGSFAEILHSVKDILFSLADNIKVFPGHGQSTSIGFEKKFNDIINY